APLVGEQPSRDVAGDELGPGEQRRRYDLRVVVVVEGSAWLAGQHLAGVGVVSQEVEQGSVVLVQGEAPQPAGGSQLGARQVAVFVRLPARATCRGIAGGFNGACTRKPHREEKPHAPVIHRGTSSCVMGDRRLQVLRTKKRNTEVTLRE